MTLQISSHTTNYIGVFVARLCIQNRAPEKHFILQLHIKVLSPYLIDYGEYEQCVLFRHMEGW